MTVNKNHFTTYEGFLKGLPSESTFPNDSWRLTADF